MTEEDIALAEALVSRVEYTPPPPKLVPVEPRLVPVEPRLLTTEDVRSTYQWGESACGCCAERREEDGVAFDEWLADVSHSAWVKGHMAGLADAQDPNFLEEE